MPTDGCNYEGCDISSFEEYLQVSQYTIQERFTDTHSRQGGFTDKIFDKIYSTDNPITRSAYFEWALERIGGQNTNQALVDLLYIAGNNLSTGMMGLAMGGDLAPGIGSGNAYSVAYETILPEGSYPGTSRAAHFYNANQALLKDMNSDPEFAQAMNELIPNLTEQISTGSGKYSSPQGWTWHHHPDVPGLMQLVPSIQHTSPLLRLLFLDNNGNGGFANWGK